MLAIVIPYYKLKFFKQTLQSLAIQTNKNFKVYIGNDNSTQNPLEIINEFKDLINIEYFSFKTNIGKISLTKQWHRCLEKVQEENYFMILGDDDVLEKNVVESFYLSQKETNTFAVTRFATILIDENNNQLSQLFTHPIIEKSTDFLIRKIKGETRSSLSEYVYSKEIYLQKKFYNFPLAWYADDLALLKFSNFDSVYTINNATVYVRISCESISGSKNNENLKIKSSLQFYYLILKNYKNKFTKNQIKIILERGERFFFKKMQIKESLFFIKFHLINFGLYSTLKFLRRIVINYKN